TYSGLSGMDRSAVGEGVSSGRAVSESISDEQNPTSPWRGRGASLAFRAVSLGGCGHEFAQTDLCYLVRGDGAAAGGGAGHGATPRREDDRRVFSPARQADRRRLSEGRPLARRLGTETARTAPAIPGHAGAVAVAAAHRPE